MPGQATSADRSMWSAQTSWDAGPWQVRTRPVGQGVNGQAGADPVGRAFGRPTCATHWRGMNSSRQLIVLLPTFDNGLARPVFVYADIAKYQVPAVRLVTT